MGKTGLLILLLGVALLGVAMFLPAQTTNPNQSVPEPGVAVPDRLSAPQLGHPLNPADVMILTGKAKPEPQTYAPQMYYGASDYTPYPRSGSPLPLLSGGGALDSTAALNSSSLRFRGLNRKPFFVFGNGAPRLPASFLVPGGFVAPFPPFVPLFGFDQFVRPLRFGTTQQGHR